jgi:hypothetical protein
MQLITKLKTFYQKNERFLVPGVLVFGVIIDFVTFRSIEIGSAFILLCVHWILAGGMITFLLFQGSKERTKYKSIKYLHLFAPLLVQFSFGATLSAAFIFYWFSGSFSASWPIFLLVGFLMIANEKFREQYMRPTVQLSVYFFITFSLLSVMLPYAFNSLSAWIFLASGILSLLIVLSYVHLLSKGLPKILKQKQTIFFSVFCIFGIMNILYFTNLIPPIPLSLTDAGIYHSIERVGNKYAVQAEYKTLIGRLLPGEWIHLREGDTLHALTSIFAPDDLQADIVHEWQHFDTETYGWETMSEISYSMTGGRKEGYRGFSMRPIADDGLWRVRVKTERGQVIGSVWFWTTFIEKRPRIITIKK